MKKKQLRYADLDVVNTRKGLRIITDLNNLPHCTMNVMRKPEEIALRFSLSKKDTVSFLHTVNANVGKIIRVIVEERKLKNTKPLREISSTWYASFHRIPTSTNSVCRIKTKDFDAQTFDVLEEKKYYAHFADSYRLVTTHSKSKEAF